MMKKIINNPQRDDQIQNQKLKKLENLIREKADETENQLTERELFF